jgi:FKBP-type peptidyl-prolyl cis-trans isomerase FkpA
MKLRHCVFVFIGAFLFSACGDMYSPEEQKEFDAKIEKFIQEKGWQMERSESGLYFELKEEGNGKPIPLDAQIYVTYSGRLLNGKLFDESGAEPRVFRANQLIEGWREALLMMEEGSSARIIVPPHLAYKKASKGDIPADAILVFDFTVHSFD